MAQGFGAWGNDLYTGRRSYQIVAHRRLWYTIALITGAIAVVLLIKPGLNPGIEFSGGTQLTLSDVRSPSQDLAVSTVREVFPGESPKVVNVGPHGLRIQMSEITTPFSGVMTSMVERTVTLLTSLSGAPSGDGTTSDGTTGNAPTDSATDAATPSPSPTADVGTTGNATGDSQLNELVTRLATAFDIPEDSISHTFIGPTWGADVSRKTITGIGWFVVFVAVVMTVYFRNWRMAIAALVALVHDLLITVGVYAAVGWEVTPATVIGFLTILGYSVYDTVVVFDKVRENTADTLDQSRYTYAEKANLAVNQTLVRSINTSVVALLPVGAILVVGAFVLHAGTLRDIALALFVGMAIGTFSSIFLATPLEVTLRELEPPIRAHTRKVRDARRAAAVGTDEQVAVVPVGQLRPGAHQGQAAQPRRRR